MKPSTDTVLYMTTLPMGSSLLCAGRAYAWPEASEAWSDRTTSAPSPTAAATRFVEPLRTSPIAKTPGPVHSSRSGPRSAAFQCRERSGWRLASSPVTTKPVSVWPQKWPRPPAPDPEPLVVMAHERDQPLRPRRGTDHGEERRRLDPAVGTRTRDHHGFELLVPLERSHLTPGPDADIRLGLDLVDEVA